MESVCNPLLYDKKGEDMSANQFLTWNREFYDFMLTPRFVAICYALLVYVSRVLLKS